MAHASHISHCLAPRAGYRQRTLRALLVIETVFRTLRERRALMQLDERALKDIGLSKADAHGEWSRPFWDVPRGRAGTREDWNASPRTAERLRAPSAMVRR